MSNEPKISATVKEIIPFDKAMDRASLNAFDRLEFIKGAMWAKEFLSTLPTTDEREVLTNYVEWRNKNYSYERYGYTSNNDDPENWHKKSNEAFSELQLITKYLAQRGEAGR